MRMPFKKAVVTGLLATSALTFGIDAVQAEKSYYNYTAVRKEGERRAAAAKIVEKNCWRPKTGEGENLYPAAVAAIRPDGDSLVGRSLYDRVVEADIAFCPVKKQDNAPPVGYDHEARIVTAKESLGPQQSLAYLRKAAFHGLLLSDPALKILDTASAEKRVRQRLYITASGIAAEVVMAVDENENGRPQGWKAVQENYGALFNSVREEYKKTKTGGGTREEALEAAGLAAYQAVFGVADWVRHEMRGELQNIAHEIRAGKLDGRPVDDDDSKLEAVFRRSAQLMPGVNIVKSLVPPSREELFSPYPDIFHDLQNVDYIRYEDGYGAKSAQARGVLKEMEATGNPTYKSIKPSISR